MSAIKDPTGCGDAYRAGLLYGLLNKLDWEITGRVAALMGAIKIEHHGTQNHRFDLAEFADRFHQAFKRETWEAVEQLELLVDLDRVDELSG